MTTHMHPFVVNRNRLTALMEEESCLVFFGAVQTPYSPYSTLPFRQFPDFWYLTGISFPGCILILRKEQGNIEEILIIPEVTEIKRQWDSDLLEVDEAKERSGISQVIANAAPERLITKALSESKIIYVYSFSSEMRFPLAYRNSSIKRQFHGMNFIEVRPLIESLRVQKSDWEIEAIRRANKITGEAFLECVKNISRFSNEREFQNQLTYLYASNEADHAFEPIIAAGANATVLHYVKNNSPFKNGNLLLVDTGARTGMYNADMTRTFPLKPVSNRQSRVFDSVHTVFQKAKSFIEPGKSIVDINRFVAQHIENELLSLGLLTTDEIKNATGNSPAYRKYYMHSASHFLGLDVHDCGNRNQPLKAGAVITLEPGIYIKEEGIGIRIEDDILITEHGSITIPNGVPSHWSDLLDS